MVESLDRSTYIPVTSPSHREDRRRGTSLRGGRMAARSVSPPGRSRNSADGRGTAGNSQGHRLLAIPRLLALEHSFANFKRFSRKRIDHLERICGIFEHRIPQANAASPSINPCSKTVSRWCKRLGHRLMRLALAGITRYDRDVPAWMSRRALSSVHYRLRSYSDARMAPNVCVSLRNGL